MTKVNREDIALMLAATGFFACLFLLVSRIETLTTEKYLNPPPEHIELFGFGFKESLADSLWLRWIQDADTCQTYIQPMQKLNPDRIDPYSLLEVPRYKVCDTSWSFKMLDAVTLLAPRFEMPYLAGASMLAILVEDFPGASVIYDRGVRQYPQNWQLLYRAAFHYQYNIRDLPKAAQLLEQSVRYGAPIWVRSLASRLYSEAGQLEMALATLLEYQKTLDNNEEAQRKVAERIADLKKRMAGLQQKGP